MSDPASPTARDYWRLWLPWWYLLVATGVLVTASVIYIGRIVSAFMRHGGFAPEAADPAAGNLWQIFGMQTGAFLPLPLLTGGACLLGTVYFIWAVRIMTNEDRAGELAARARRAHRRMLLPALTVFIAGLMQFGLNRYVAAEYNRDLTLAADPSISLWDQATLVDYLLAPALYSVVYGWAGWGHVLQAFVLAAVLLATARLMRRDPVQPFGERP